MRYRETDALLREADSRDNLAAALKDGKAAKEFRKEREALEKAVGGKKKLDEADRILADARKAYDECVIGGHEEARRIVRVADDKIKGEVQALEKKEAGLAKLKDDLSRQNVAAVETARKQKKDAETLYDRETAVRTAEAASKVMDQGLVTTQARLAKLELELDIRAARFKEAAA